MDPSCSLHSLIDQETVVEEEEDDDVIVTMMSLFGDNDD